MQGVATARAMSSQLSVGFCFFQPMVPDGHPTQKLPRTCSLWPLLSPHPPAASPLLLTLSPPLSLNFCQLGRGLQNLALLRLLLLLLPPSQGSHLRSRLWSSSLVSSEDSTGSHTFLGSIHAEVSESRRQFLASPCTHRVFNSGGDFSLEDSRSLNLLKYKFVSFFFKPNPLLAFPFPLTGQCSCSRIPRGPSW